MTIEELREQYQKEIKQYYENNDECEYVDIFPNDYSDWLEQKLTQPCPECEKHKAVWDNLKTNMEADVKILREQLEKARRGSIFIDSLDTIAAKAFILTVYLNLMKEKEAGDEKIMY